ncbi:MAG: L-idonate 5-dehydrogenase [Planctomycetota bacterium]
MRALVLHKAGELRFDEYDSAEPGPGEVVVRMAAGGICGSDLHYYAHGGFGAICVREPIVLGHEVSGYVEQVGDSVEGLNPGQLVSVSPSQPCMHCDQCNIGLVNHCADMRFLGSAMRCPHVQGAFREQMTVAASQCVPCDGLTPGAAALAEPLAVCLHAATHAVELAGRDVLITGCGPIGILMVSVARHLGAARVVATDVTDFALSIAADAGADEQVNVARDHGVLRSGPRFDLHFECSGAPGVIGSVVPAMKPCARIVQVGFGGDSELPFAAMTAKELELRGSFRFRNEFPQAVRLLQSDAINAEALVTQSFRPEQASLAFETAQDRSRAMKVQFAFNVD